jgi:hypothetical protein
MLRDQLNHSYLTEILQEPSHAEEAIIVNNSVVISIHGPLFVNSTKRTLSRNIMYVSIPNLVAGRWVLKDRAAYPHWLYITVKISLLQAVEAHRVARG